MDNGMFYTRFEKALLRHSEPRLALLFIDMRDPATDGGEAGSLVLDEVARRLHRCIEPGDSVARLNSGEFLVVLTGVEGRERTAAVAKTMLGLLTQPYCLGPRPLQLACSIGIALCPEHGASFMALARGAVTALHRAQDAVGSAYRFHSPG